MVDAERLNRYQEKLSFTQQRFSYIKKWAEQNIDTKTKFAIYKVTQEIIEALSDITAMISKDEKLTVKDDYSNIDHLEKMNILSEKYANTLRESNGLRNRLVHSYNGMDDNIAINSIIRLTPILMEVKGVLEEWINNNYE